MLHFRKIIKMLKNEIVVFDFDGTLTAFAYPYYDKDEKGKRTLRQPNRLLPCRDDEIYEYSKTKNLYQPGTYKTLDCMKYIIKHLDVNNIYILTRTEPTLIDKKNVCIQKEFPMFKREHILHVYKAEEKVLELEKLKNRYHKLPIFIEDTFKTILNAEEAEVARGIHISFFLI